MKFPDRLFLIGKPSQDELIRKLEANPDDVFRILNEHLSHKSYQVLSKRIPNNNDKCHYEWIINPFQYVRQSIGKDQFFEFAQYLNRSDVWENAAPHFFDSSSWTRVYEPMLVYCAKDRVQELTDILNKKGLLHACFEELGLSPEQWGFRFFA